MLTVLSPAKKLSKDCFVKTDRFHKPQFLDESKALVGKMKKMTPTDFMSLMTISENLAELNWERMQNWDEKFNPENSREAIFSFKGDTYSGLDADSLSDQDLNFAQKNIRILSGLYGILRPLDLMKPYRLEMGTSFANKKGKNLYEFWGDKVQKNVLNELKDQKSDLLINLASKEYFTVLGKLPEDINVVTPTFKDYKNGNYKIISFYAKKARGLMARWIIQNKVINFEDLSGFDLDGYKYSKAESTATVPVFLRKS